MDTLIKTLDIRNANLMATTGGRRKEVASFNGIINIYEVEHFVPVRGRMTRQPKTLYASFVLTEPIDCHCDINSGMVFDAVGDVEGETEKRRLIFAGMKFFDNDPVKGTYTFGIPDDKLILNMLDM